MGRGSRWFVTAVVAVGLASTASADPFGGFSKDRSSFLVGTDRVCTPVAPGGAAPACRKVAGDQVSKLGFARGAPQRGTTARVTAEASGAVLRVRDARTRAVLAEWNSPDAIARVGAVFVSDDDTVVAVEYETRAGGRTALQAVALAVAKQAPAQPATPAAPAVRAPLPPAQVKALAAALRSSDRLLARKQWAKAETGYRKALAIDEHSAAARFGLAASLARRGKPAEAVAELVTIGRSPDAAAPVWLVEARSSAHFAALRGDPDFRRASGIDPDPARPYTAYERLVGQGGHWEQPGLPCQEPTINLKLDRTRRTFALKIQTRCQGDDETTTLNGRWKADGAAALLLTFPNPPEADETLECALADKGGEDTLSCTLEDMAFSMRVVRR
jgi:hypothetical protein